MGFSAVLLMFGLNSRKLLGFVSRGLGFDGPFTVTRLLNWVCYHSLMGMNGPSGLSVFIVGLSYMQTAGLQQTRP